MANTLTLAQIKKRIPHRAPILLLDAVTDYTINENLTATRHFAADDLFFQGHFPGFPVLPGVLAVEAMAQAAAVLISLSRNLMANQTTYLFMGIEHAKFKTPLEPNQTLTIRAEKLYEKMNIFKFHGTAHVGATLAAETDFTAKLIVKPDAKS